MRRSVFSLVAGMLFSICLAFSAQAQQVNIDLGKIDPQLAAKILEATKKAVPPTPELPTASQAKEWADVGKGVAEAIGAAARALGTEANEFVKTPVGWWVSFFVFWYLLGKKLWMIVGGILMWTAITSIIWRSFRIFHMPKQVMVERLTDGTEKFETKAYEFNSNEAKTFSAVGHAVFFAAFTVVALVIVF